MINHRSFWIHWWGKKINRLLLLHRMFSVPQFRARSSNSFIVIYDFSFNFVNSRRWWKFFACDILASTDIRTAQGTFKSSKFTWVLFSTERAVIMIALEIKLCLCMWVCFLIKFLKNSWLTHDVKIHGSWCKLRSHGLIRNQILCSDFFLYVVRIVKTNSKQSLVTLKSLLRNKWNNVNLAN